MDDGWSSRKAQFAGFFAIVDTVAMFTQYMSAQEFLWGSWPTWLKR
jgi:hypothetical protein